MSPRRLAVLNGLGLPGPWQARAETVLADAVELAFGVPAPSADLYQFGTAAGVWLSGVLFAECPHRVECPEA